MCVSAKRSAGVTVVSLLRRSPDLNPLDFSVWNEVNTRMRHQEAAWPSGRHETRAAYLQRLRRTAMNLPSGFIDKAIGALADSCKLLVKAKGGHLPEGGKRAKLQ